MITPDSQLRAQTAPVLREVARERVRQDDMWGEQNHDWITGRPAQKRLADHARASCERHFADGDGGWQDILMEEFFEALAEGDTAKLRAELIQVAAVAVAWVEAIDRRPSDG